MAAGEHLRRAIKLMTEAMDEIDAHMKETDAELRPEIRVLLEHVGQLLITAQPKMSAKRD